MPVVGMSGALDSEGTRNEVRRSRLIVIESPEQVRTHGSNEEDSDLR